MLSLLSSPRADPPGTKGPQNNACSCSLPANRSNCVQKSKLKLKAKVRNKEVSDYDNIETME